MLHSLLQHTGFVILYPHCPHPSLNPLNSHTPTRLRRENEALKGLLLELAADRQAAQARLADLQQKMADMAATSITEEVRGGGGLRVLSVLATATASAVCTACLKPIYDIQSCLACA